MLQLHRLHITKEMMGIASGVIPYSLLIPHMEPHFMLMNYAKFADNIPPRLGLCLIIVSRSTTVPGFLRLCLILKKAKVSLKWYGYHGSGFLA